MEVGIEFLSFKWMHLTIGAGHWILTALRIVELSYILESGVVAQAVIAAERSLLALLSYVGSDVATLQPLPALMCALNVCKQTTNQLILCRRILIQVNFELSKFPPPLTAIFFVRAPHFQLLQAPLQPAFPHDSEFGLTTDGTRVPAFPRSLDTPTTELVSAATGETWLL